MTLNRALFSWTFGILGSLLFMQALDHRLIFGNWGRMGGFGATTGFGIAIMFGGLLIGVIDTKEW